MEWRSYARFQRACRLELAWAWAQPRASNLLCDEPGQTDEPSTRALHARLQFAGGDWPAVIRTMDPLFRDETLTPASGAWDCILAFLHDAVKCSHAADAVRMLDETGAGERWRPLREALQCVASGNASHLLAVAPEVRGPAASILDDVWPESERPEPRPRKKTPRKKRLRF